MRFVVLFLVLNLVACTTVNVYTEKEPTVVIKPTVRNSDNPYDRRRSN